MLVLTRGMGQTIVINDNIEVTVIEIRSEQVHLSIEAPCSIPIYRKEPLDQIETENSDDPDAMIVPEKQTSMFIMGVGQAIVIGDNIKIMVVEINGGQVRLGTEAHRSILVYRKELLEQINAHASARPDVATVAKVKTPVLAKVHLGRLVSVRCKELLVRLIRKLHL